MKAKTQAEAIQIVERYCETSLAEFAEAVADPHVEGVWAVRYDEPNDIPCCEGPCVHEQDNNDPIDFIVHADGDVEECEFETWPPSTYN